jgi:hypothetical protein
MSENTATLPGFCKGKRQDLKVEDASLQKGQENPEILVPYLAFFSCVLNRMKIFYRDSVEYTNAL